MTLTPAPARWLVRKVRFRGREPHFSHEAGPSARGGAAAIAAGRALAHEVLPMAVMAWAVLAGHGSAAMAAAAIALALLSFAYAPLARANHWAREHLADLWAMLLLMAAMALSRGDSTFPGAGNVDVPRVGAHAHVLSAGFGMGGTGGMGGAGSATAVVVAVVVAWALARAFLACRGWRIHSLVSAVVCGAGLVWMLAA
ncbi:hypothetical protein [Leifsonia sp. NPDC058230]|uniref:hypothetical protein n=1 Tax=Leifsonia sp. NPDC058230 TaxID=3346391 RepID=UPI0036D9A54B